MDPLSIPVRDAVPDFATETVVEVPGFGLCRRVDVYDAWLFAQAEVDVAFRAWADADVAHRRDLQCIYQAALDREDQAAVVLAAALNAPAVGLQNLPSEGAEVPT